MKAALINSATREVVNTIVADATRDKAPDGFDLVNLDDGSMVMVGWMHSRDRGFFMGPEMKARIEAERIAAWNEPSAVQARAAEKNQGASIDSVEAGDGR